MPFVRSDVQGVLTMLDASPAPKMHEVDAATARMRREPGNIDKNAKRPESETTS